MDNRGLYLAVADLVARNKDNGRSLQDFLRALRAALEPHYGEPALAPEQFVAALDAAFSGPPAARDAGWRLEDLSGSADGARADGPADAAAVDRILKCQTLDMEDAEASGALRDEYRFFGRTVGRPEGTLRATAGYFYNWSPQTYVECGIAGAFGGWEPGDDTGRMLVPGEVAVLTDEGITSMPADEVESPVFELPVLTWEQVAEFLWSGQNYE